MWSWRTWCTWQQRWNDSLKGKELGHFKIRAPLLDEGRMGGKTKGLFLSPKLNYQKGEMKFLVSTKVKPNPKLIIVILSVFIVWE